MFTRKKNGVFDFGVSHKMTHYILSTFASVFSNLVCIKVLFSSLYSLNNFFVYIHSSRVRHNGFN